MRRLLTFFAVAAATAGGLLFWLHDGNVDAALAEGRAAVNWDASALAKSAGLTSRDPSPAAAKPGPTLVLDEPAGPASE